MKKRLFEPLRISLFVVIGLLSAHSSALTLEHVEFFGSQASAVQIILSFDEEPPVPSSFTINDPARLTFDFPGVSNALDKRRYSPKFKYAQKVIVLEAQGRTRMVVGMDELADYQTRIVGNDLIVDIGTAQNSFSSEALGQMEDASESNSRSQVSELDFRRGDNGEGNLRITLTDPTIDVDVTKQGRSIFVKLNDTFLSDEQRHTYDVVDFGTAVKEFSARQLGSQTQIEIIPDEGTDYLVYQIDGVFVVSVKALPADGSKAESDIRGNASFEGDKLSLNFQEIEVRAVLQIIAEFVDLNLVASDSVRGSITLRLKDVPWDQALDIVLKTQGLDKRINHSVMYVAPIEEISARETLQIKASRQQIELEPLQSEHFRLVYSIAKDIESMLKSFGQGFGSLDDDRDVGREGLLSSRGSVVVDERTNSLIIKDTASSLEEIRDFITLLDIPVQQVMIEARIVRASDDFSRALGIRWGGADFQNDAIVSASLDSVNDLTTQANDRSSSFTSAFQGFVDQGLSSSEASARASQGLDAYSINFPDSLFVDLGVGGASASSIALSYLGSNFNVAAELSALETNGQGEVVSQPKIITGDKQPATIKSGQEYGFQQATASGATSIAFQEAVLELEVTPSITPDGKVFMKLKITQDSIAGFISGEGNSQIPLIDTTELETQVLIANGETIVLGGVFELTDLESVIKTPFLGDIPILGRLFKRREVSKQKSETLIFITPRIISDTFLN